MSLYTAEAVAPSGEKIYFALESIENEDKTKWTNYRNTAIILTQGGGTFCSIGSLEELASYIDDEVRCKEFLSTRKYPHFWTGDPEKFEELKSLLQKQNIVSGSTKAEELKTIFTAAGGLNVDQQTHVAYVSKSPIVDRIRFTSNVEGNHLGRYIDTYGDLIMSVGVTIGDCLENRGIFKNPWSIVQGGYKGIAMMLHSFTCAVVQKHFPAVQTFQVRPLKNMAEIFIRSVSPKEQITIDNTPADQYEGDFEHERMMKMPVKILADLYRDLY
jgi:hypothetical protein